MYIHSQGYRSYKLHTLRMRLATPKGNAVLQGKPVHAYTALVGAVRGICLLLVVYWWYSRVVTLLVIFTLYGVSQGVRMYWGKLKPFSESLQIEHTLNTSVCSFYSITMYQSVHKFQQQEWWQILGLWQSWWRSTPHKALIARWCSTEGNIV